MNPNKIIVVSAKGDYIEDSAGHTHLDLCMGYGTVSLGHTYAPIVDRLASQLETYASPGFVDTVIFDQAKMAIENFVPGDYSLHGFYPSGANAVEMALKMAMMTTNKQKIISFENSMHGKTLFANHLGFETCLEVQHQICKIPFIPQSSEEDILEKTAAYMSSNNVAAVIVEPIQMSGGGHQASHEFYTSLEKIAKQYGVIQIYDEILTGFYRTGKKFVYQEWGVSPDILLTGKAMGSGFPVAAILHKNSISTKRHMRTGGTHFNHPLACASVLATITEYKNLKIEQTISAIEDCVIENLPRQSLSGAGALWNINLGSRQQAMELVKKLSNNKVIVSFYDQYIRLLPSYLIDTRELEDVCNIVRNFK